MVPPHLFLCVLIDDLEATSIYKRHSMSSLMKDYYIQTNVEPEPNPQAYYTELSHFI